MLKRTELNEKIAEEIEEEEKKKRNRKILKVLGWIFIPLFILFSIGYLLLRYIGNMGIVVREYPFYSNKLTDDLHGIKIIHFSDIHYNEYSSKDTITKLVNMINHTHPDIVIFTGDLVDSEYSISLEEKEFFITEFSNIEYTIGKYSIKGEEDGEIFHEIMTNSNFEILDNSVKKIYCNHSYFQLIGVNDENFLYSSLKKGIDTSIFTLVITHMPDNADDIVSNFSPDMILAGHSHNGQVRLPFIGPMMKKIGSKKYIDSYYTIENTHLLISGGIGNTKYHMRLFNHPSINFIRLKKEDN